MQLFSQSTAIFKIVYKFEYIRDTTKPKEFYEELFALYVGKNESVFLSRSKEYNDSVKNAAREDFYAGRKQSIEFNIGVPSTPERIYTNFLQSKQTKTVEYRGNFYVVPLTMERIKWSLLPDKKMILGYACNAATCFFKGRNYKVFYTTKLSGTSAGPWKLNGLPGIILEAKDAKNEVVFKADQILLKPTYYEIAVPKNSIVTTQKDIEKMMNAVNNGGANAANGDNSGVKIVGSKFEGGNVNAKRKLIINNPIEKIP